MAPNYETQRYHLLHEMRTIRAKARLGLQTSGERRVAIKTMALLRKNRDEEIRAANLVTVEPIKPLHESIILDTEETPA